MSTALRLPLISVEDYLAGEQVSPVKHEYVGGYVYAMAGVRNVHGIIQANVIAALHTRLRGTPCRPFGSDTKIRIRLPSQIRFYYPDVSIICRPNRQTDSFQDEPVAIFEILSRGTRRLDEGEKKDAYLAIASLQLYILVEQEMSRIITWRRTTNGFEQAVYDGMEEVVPLDHLGISVPLREIYDGVEFSPDGTDESE